MQAKLIPVNIKPKALLTKRPANTPDIPMRSIEQVVAMLNEAKYILEQYAAHREL